MVSLWSHHFPELMGKFCLGLSQTLQNVGCSSGILPSVLWGWGLTLSSLTGAQAAAKSFISSIIYNFLGFLKYTNYLYLCIYIYIFSSSGLTKYNTLLLFHVLQTILKAIIHLIVIRHCILLQEVLIHRQKKKKNPKAQEDGFPLIHERDESTQIHCTLTGNPILTPYTETR